MPDGTHRGAIVTRHWGMTGMLDDLHEGRATGVAITPDTRWMTYREMAEFLGMKEESARRRAQRDGWPRQLGNDGRTRVGVPGDAVAPVEGSGATNRCDDHPGGTAALREALSRERERADRAEAAAAVIPDLRERAGRAEGEAAALRKQVTIERDRAAAAEAELEKARLGRAAAEAGVNGLWLALAEARRPFWRRWLGVAALCAAPILLPPVASAQVDPSSATWAMPGCREIVGGVRGPTPDAYLKGYCMGVVTGISVKETSFCPPETVTFGQIVGVVAHYIDARPERQHENFTKLVTEALRVAWPCRPLR